uniref:Cytochrome P450 n=1 Tax=Mycena chlorophos TaxID=658473 RepID=A0ABQ0LKP8_MYCCL|nr:cytochrome P450 [Mycena chlorophos]
MFTVGLGIAVVATLARRLAAPATPLPPGPRRLPLIGNLFQMPTENVPLVFHDWAKVYGDIIYLAIPRRSFLILDSVAAATELLDKKSAIYSDRPNFPLYDLFGWETCLALIPYGKKLIKHRQMHHSYLNQQKCAEHKPMQLREARTLASNLLAADANESDYQIYLNRFATGIITQIVAGHRITDPNDPYLVLSKQVIQAFDEAGPPGRSLIDLFPIFAQLPRWFPGTYYASVADKWRPIIQELHDLPFRMVQSQTALGSARPSFVLTQLTFMENKTLTAQEEQDMKGSTSAMFAAGEVSTWSSLSVFVLAMVLHPDCQLRAQQEIDHVIGSTRLPEFSDRASLPYLECLYQEVYRWQPVIPLGLPHRCTTNNVYRGMFIPEGTIVLANIKSSIRISPRQSILTKPRGMTLDPSIYHDPTKFIPERYLAAPEGKEEPFFAAKFGFGRRYVTDQYI